MSEKNYIGKSNSHNNGNGDMDLTKHLTDVGEACYHMAHEISWSEDPMFDNRAVIACATICGYLHDIGKATTDFQNHIKNGTECTVDHSYVSAYIASNYIDFGILNEYKDAIVSTILYHHPTTHDGENQINVPCMITDELIEYVGEIVELINKNEFIKDNAKYGYNMSLNANVDEDDCSLDTHYFFENPKINRVVLYTSIIQRSSDFSCSSGRYNTNDLVRNIPIPFCDINRPYGFDEERFNSQKGLATIDSHTRRTSMISAPAGWGKTLYGAMFGLTGTKKLYWVCPTRDLTLATYKNIQNSLSQLGLERSVALVRGGVYEESNDDRIDEYRSGDAMPDITVINIDTYMRPLFNTDFNKHISAILECDCIFDECHEYMSPSAITAMFDIIMKCRIQYCMHSKTILMTASGVKAMYGRYITDDCIMYGECKSIMDQKIKLRFIDKLPTNLKGTDSIVLVGSVNSAQIIKMNRCTDNIVHSRYNECDKADHINYEYEHHAKELTDGNSREVSCVSTSIMGTGHDVSYKDMYIVYVTPLTILQYPGRNDRWGTLENPSTSILNYVDCDTPIYRSEKKIIDLTYNVNLQKKFYDELKKKFGEKDEPITKGELYNFANRFMNDDHLYDHKNLYRKFLEKGLKALSTLEYKYSNPKKDDNDSIHLSNKNGLRSIDTDKVFVMVADSKDMTEPMQVDLNAGIISEEDLIEGQDFMLRVLKEKRIKKFNALKARARCSDTPFLLDKKKFNYTKELGLYKVKNK